MKSERRHELQQNELAKDLEHVVEGAKPYTGAIVAAIAAVVIGSLVWAYVSGTRQAQREQGWSQFQDALAANEDEQLDLLLKVAKENEGTAPAYWALQTAADVEANRGAAMVFSDKKEAEEHLLAAKNNYQKVTKAPSSDELLSQRAWLGYAKAEESLFGLNGDAANLDAAKEAYERIKKTWPESSVAKVATQRLDFLAMNDTAEFYNWLAEYKPTLPPLGGNGAGGFNPLAPGGDGGRGGLQLPEDLDFPDLGLDSAAPAGDSDTAPAATDVPATDATSTEPAATETPEATSDDVAPAEPAPEPAPEAPANEPAAEASNDVTPPTEPEPQPESPAAEPDTEPAPADDSSAAEAPEAEASETEASETEAPAAEEPATADEPKTNE